MKFEVVESRSGWIVRRDGVELSRHDEQDEALADIGVRLRGASGSEEAELSYSLAMRYLTRT